MTVKIMIDPGHGGNDPGAMGNGLREKDLTLAISKAIKKELVNYEGVEVRLTREDDRYLSLADRCAMANRWGADFFLSIHINSGGGNGFESYVYRAASAKSRTAQDQIHAAVTAVTNAKGWKDRGKKEAGFYVIKNTRMPALLTENGFIDTEGNADDLKQAGFIQALAVAHAKGIAAAFGLKRKAATPTPEQKIEDRYDMSYLKGYELEGLRSSRHADELMPYLEWAMDAHAQCVLILRRDFDLRHLQNALNKMFPDNVPKS